MKSVALQKQTGMTLLEVLIATAILTIISAMAFLSIDNMVKAKITLNEHTEQLNQANLAFYWLQNDLQFAVSSEQYGLTEAEFIGNMQSFTLTRFKGQTATSTRISNNQTSIDQPLQKVSWYVRDQQLVRAVLPAHSAGYGENGQARALLPIESFACSYQNAAGIRSNQWPNERRENGQLPYRIQCLVVTKSGQSNEFNIIPWQKIW